MWRPKLYIGDLERGFSGQSGNLDLNLNFGPCSEWILTAETACKRDKSHVVVDDKLTNIESITEFVVQ